MSHSVAAVGSALVTMDSAAKYRKALLKKLRQVEALKARATSGEALDTAQIERIRGEAALREELGDAAPVNQST